MAKIYPKWSIPELVYLKENYGKIKLPELAKTLGRSYKATNTRCMILGLTKNKIKKQWMINQGKRKYTRNEDFFDLAIKKGDNIYWAGFVATDGCIDAHNTEVREKILKFKLQNKDKTQVIKFMNALEYNAPLQHNNQDNGWQFSLTSNKIASDLEYYFNIIPAKTHSLQPPNLVDRIDILRFLVGCIDGDGCIYKCNDKIALQFISASKNFALWIKNQWEKIISKSLKLREVKPQKKNHCVCYQFSINGKAAEILYKILMSVDCPRLERKWAPWQHLLDN